MMRLLNRVILLLTLLCALPVLLIRAQPYDDYRLRALLTPPAGCPAPCFMGIRPGVTLAEDAIAILDAHDWVAGVDGKSVELMHESQAYGTPPVTSIVGWEWGPDKPAWIDAHWKSGLVVIDQQVAAITIRTRIPLGDVLMVYGLPANGRFTRSKGGSLKYSFAYTAWYPAYCMRIDAGGVGLSEEIYLQPVQITLQQTDLLRAKSSPPSNSGCV